MGDVFDSQAITAIGTFLTGAAALLAVALNYYDRFYFSIPPRFSRILLVTGVVLILITVFLAGRILPPLLEGETTTGGLRDIFHQVGAGENMTWTIPPGTIGYQYVDDDGCRHSGSQGLRISYNIPQGKQGGWGVSWLSAPRNNFDGSRFSTLNFWVRGNQGGEKFMVGLKDDKGHEALVESVDLLKEGVSGSAWKSVSISLTSFKSRGVDTAAIQTLSISFTNGDGKICIDDIGFK
jgi:hypothetical protein